MMIRNGFVTNSSSTNYIIISKEELNAEMLCAKFGVKENSPLYNDFYDLFSSLIDYNGDFRYYEGGSLEDKIKSIFGLKTLKKYKKYIKKGYKFMYGSISDDEPLSAAIAFDKFILKKHNKFYADFSDWGY